MSIYKDALKYWGHKAQIEQTQEECAELIVVLNKFFNRKLAHVCIDDVAAEIADVVIMCNQMAEIIGPDRVNNYMAIKKKGLREALDAER